MISVVVIICGNTTFKWISIQFIVKKLEVSPVGWQDSFSKSTLLSTNWKKSENNQVFILGTSCVNTSTVWDTVHIYGQWYYTDLE